MSARAFFRSSRAIVSRQHAINLEIRAAAAARRFRPRALLRRWLRLLLSLSKKRTLSCPLWMDCCWLDCWTTRFRRPKADLWLSGLALGVSNCAKDYVIGLACHCHNFDWHNRCGIEGTADARGSNGARREAFVFLCTPRRSRRMNRHRRIFPNHHAVVGEQYYYQAKASRRQGLQGATAFGEFRE